MTRCANYAIVDIAIYEKETLKNCYKKWMQSVSTNDKWTICSQSSITDSVVKMLSRRDKSLIMCRGQFISTTKTEEWTESPASQKLDARGKSTRKNC